MWGEMIPLFYVGGFFSDSDMQNALYDMVDTFRNGNRNNIASRNLKQLVGKIENYIDFLKENEEFETKFYDVGDGLSVSIRKNDI